jgi:hypothetical protein
MYLMNLEGRGHSKLSQHVRLHCGRGDIEEVVGVLRLNVIMTPHAKLRIKL